MGKMYMLHVQSNTADTSALSGNEMPCHPSASTHGRWPALATVAQNKLLSHQRQRLRICFPYLTPLLLFCFFFLLLFFIYFFLPFFMFWGNKRGHLLHTFLSSVVWEKKKLKIKIVLFWPPSRNQLFCIQLRWILPYPLTTFQSEWAPYRDFPVRIQKNAVRDTPRSKGWEGGVRISWGRGATEGATEARWQKVQKNTHLKHWLTKIWSKM